MSEQPSKQHQAARRKLLKAVVYAPPVILGSMVATPRMAIGAIGAIKVCNVNGGPPVTITISSGTNACCPCVPNSVKWDPAKFAHFQCVTSFCTLLSRGQMVHR